MANYFQALKYPIIGWVIIDTLAVVMTRLFPVVTGIGNIPTPGGGFIVVTSWAVGAWAGYKIVEFKGNFVDVILAGVIVGLVSALLEILELGFMLSFLMYYPSSPGAFSVLVLEQLPYAVLFFSQNLFGAIIVGGFAATK